MKTVLTIAGFDPSSGAGVTADLMVFAAHGLFGTACITSLTVQSTLGVLASHAISSEIVAATLACLDNDISPSGVKVGMVSSVDNICNICKYLDILQAKDAGHTMIRNVPIVLDPVLRSSSGRELLDGPGVVALRAQLLPRVDWVTPNLDELGLLIGEPVVGREDVPRASRVLQQKAGTGEPRVGVFATGGHMDPPDDFLLLPTGEEIWMPGERVETRSTHGTGCALSSAFLCRLVQGDPPEVAAAAAKEYVAGALRWAAGVGTGHGPMNHLWPLSHVAD